MYNQKATEGDDRSHYDYSQDGSEETREEHLRKYPKFIYSDEQFLNDLRDRKTEDPIYGKLYDSLSRMKKLGVDTWECREYLSEDIVSARDKVRMKFRDEYMEEELRKYFVSLDDPRTWKAVYPESGSWGVMDIVKLFCEYNKGIPERVTEESFMRMLYLKARYKTEKSCLEKWRMMHITGFFKATGPDTADVDRCAILDWLKRECEDVMVLRDDGTATTVRKMYRDCPANQG